MNKILKNKEILLICPSFFNYEKEIKKGLESLGARVDFFDERPKNSVITKIIIRSGFGLLIKKKVDNYYNQIFSLIRKNKYDTVFVINPETIDVQKIKILRKLQPDAKFILYMWDSFKNKENSRNIVNFFDKKITFDKADSKIYNMQFLPLFYINLYEKIVCKDSYQYDICFIGTAHSDRYEIAKKIEQLAKQDNLKMYSFFYLPSRIMFWVRKVLLRQYKYGNIKDFSFTPLTQNKITHIIENSRVILDINHPLQSGLTSRTLESLGAGRKLITTNDNVKGYDFFNKVNIQVLDRNLPILDRELFNMNYRNPKKAIYDFYSLNSWLINIFSPGVDK